jgi:hypothetical protein
VSRRRGRGPDDVSGTIERAPDVPDDGAGAGGDGYRSPEVRPDAGSGDDPLSEVRAGEVRDALPADLDVTADLGPYEFPDNARRRIPGVLYLAAALVCVTARLAAGSDAVLVNDGFLYAAGVFAVFGAYCFLSGYSTVIDDTDALVAATRAVGFPVGHASAQMAWRGLRSRPTWRILLYSAEDPPAQRGLVLVDAVDGEVLEKFVEANPEDWTAEEWPDLEE